MIREYVGGSKCKVKYGGEESEAFDVKTGLRQGDALYPVLFNIALESVLRKSLTGTTRIKIGNYQQLVVAGYNVIMMTEKKEDLKITNSKPI